LIAGRDVVRCARQLAIPAAVTFQSERCGRKPNTPIARPGKKRAMDDQLQALFASFKNERDRQFIEEAMRIQREAEREGIQLRLLGSLAFRLQCPKNAAHFEALDRRITDIDFAASTRHRDQLLTFFRQQGYVIDENTLYLGGGFRYIFEHPRDKTHIDVFFDQLEMCHTVVFRDRLGIDNRTISLADLLLEKMQIVEISRKDFKDTAILLLEHGVGQDDRTIDMGYIGRIMSQDWGFFHTFSTNLGKLKAAVGQFDTFDEREKEIVRRRIDGILEQINGSEKSLKWKARAKIGTRIRWYRQVD
jgi:hypothetical protein